MKILKYMIIMTLVCYGQFSIAKKNKKASSAPTPAPVVHPTRAITVVNKSNIAMTLISSYSPYPGPYTLYLGHTIAQIDNSGSLAPRSPINLPTDATYYAIGFNNCNRSGGESQGYTTFTLPTDPTQTVLTVKVTNSVDDVVSVSWSSPATTSTGTPATGN